MTEYDELDWLYEVLYAGEEQTFFEDSFLSQNQEFLDRSMKILDASCGNGIQAVALLKHGFDVTASDISEKMLELTENRARNAGLEIKAFVASWKQLPEKPEKYDLVFCYGNSISHSKNANDRRENLQSLAKCLTADGTLVLDTRNWEKVLQSRYTIYKEREYRGRKFLPIYIWNAVEIGKPSSVTIVFVESTEKGMITYEKVLTFCPFNHDEILNEVQNIGLSVIKDSYQQECDEYSLVLRIGAR